MHANLQLSVCTCVFMLASSSVCVYVCVSILACSQLCVCAR